VILLLLALANLRVSAAPVPDYKNDVVPILREYCAGCHNDDDESGDLSVETFKQLMKGGEDGPVIVPGQAQESRMIKSLTGQAKPKMPPKKEPQPSADQIAILTAWINGGAQGPAPENDHSLLSSLTVPNIPPAKGIAPAITTMEYSPDSKWLAVGRYKRVEIMDAQSQRSVRVLPDLPGKVNAIHFSKDGTHVVVASGVAGLLGEATLWNATSGEKLHTFAKKHRDLLYDAELSPDGELLATAGYDRQIILWKVQSGEVVRTIEGHNGAIFDLAFSPDGTILASASGDETVKLWRVSDGQRLDTLNQPTAEQFSVAFTPDGNSVIAAGGDNRIRLWRLVSREKAEINPLLIARYGHEDDIVKIALSADGQWLASSSADRTVKLWTLPDLTQTKVYDQQPDLAVALAFQGKTFTAGRMNGTMQSWEVVARETDSHTNAENQAAQTSVAAAAGELQKISETEPNGVVAQAQGVTLPVEISGAIGQTHDVDLFRFRSRAGQEWALAVNAARNKSKLDSKLEVLDDQGQPIEQVVLQAMRDSYFTFRGKDSDTSGDFRLQNWREMELNEYLYANGEVVKLWMYPRGPDSGFKVYPGFGKRHTFFGTSALSHPLGEPCYIVHALPAGSQPSPNGLPVFRLNYENDDQVQQRWGADSELLFTAPKEGDYVARISDVRGFGGDDYKYTLTIRPRQPDFTIKIEGTNASVSPGSGREFTLTVERREGFDGEIRVDIAGLPEGFSATTPIVIEPGQDMALGALYAAADAKAPQGDAGKGSRLTATAKIRGETVERPVGSLGEIKLGAAAKLLVEIQPDGDSGNVVAEPGRPLEFTLEAGQTITARVKAARVDFKERIELGGEDSGRNMPHGVYVDNIGLNGLLIVEDQTERQFFITAAPWVGETTRLFHLKAGADGGQVTRPALLHIKRPKTVAAQ
jgi:hypothetical protein